MLEEAVAGLEGGVAAVAAADGHGRDQHDLPGRCSARVTTWSRSTPCTAAPATCWRNWRRRFKISVTYVPEDDPEAARAAFRPETRFLYLETIANPMTQVADLPGMCAVARAAGIPVIVDNTFASPIVFRPIEHGASIVVHSSTKYLAGHADIVGGISVFADHDLHRKVWKFHCGLGAAPDPFASWLTLRGLQTLPLRMARHNENARIMATRFAEHPAVSAVHWPGLPTHKSHALATKLLPDFGGVFSFDLVGGREAGVVHEVAEGRPARAVARRRRDAGHAALVHLAPLGVRRRAGGGRHQSRHGPGRRRHRDTSRTCGPTSPRRFSRPASRRRTPLDPYAMMGR